MSRGRLALACLAVQLAACSIVPATPPVAPDEAFPEAFATSTDWGPVELGFAGGATTLDVASMDQLEATLRHYFSLGVRPIDESLVQVSLPSGAGSAERFRVLVTVTGAIDDETAGRQFRVWVSRYGPGWSIENQAEERNFCHHAIGGVAGRICVGG